MSTPAIQIILNSDGSTTFSPSSQKALFGDLVFWNNQTKENHWPWPADSNYNPQAIGWFPAPVPPGETSGDYATPPSSSFTPAATPSNHLLLLQASPSQNRRKRDDQGGRQPALAANNASRRTSSQWLRVTQSLKPRFYSDSEGRFDERPEWMHYLGIKVPGRKS